jgi:zinc protease
VEKERRETLAALERREDRLAARAFDLFFEALYGDHPYRLPTLGLPETVRSFDAARVAAHHTRLVHPRNLVLTVAGDVDPERIAQALSARLAALPRGPFEPPNPKASVPQRAARERELRKDRAQAHLVLGFPGLTLDDPDRPALEVTTQLLAGQGGRLFLELRDRQGLAYSVSASNVEGVAPGFFAVYIATAPEKLEAARTGLLAELERLLQDAPSEAELDAAREHLVGNHAIDQQRASARALQVALDVLYGLGAEAHLEYPERVRAVSREDVARVARRVIDLDACTVGLVRP